MRELNYDKKKGSILLKVTLESRVRYQAGVNFQNLSEIV